MLKYLPGRVEIGVLLVLAIGLASLLTLFPVMDLAMAGGAVPVFLIGALLGLRKNPKLAALRQAAAAGGAR